MLHASVYLIELYLMVKTLVGFEIMSKSHNLLGLCLAYLITVHGPKSLQNSLDILEGAKTWACHEYGFQQMYRLG